MVRTMYDYYASQSIKPTYAEFTTQSQIEAYTELRRHVFRRLMLPSTYFEGKNILEFGPDTGENSIVFAEWGATVSLVEPNITAHHYIHRYFTNFGLEDRLSGISGESLTTFNSVKKFDLIDAEGFIYTIQPHNLWIKKASDLLKIHGLFVVSYLELYGSFIELLTKAIYQQIIFTSGYSDDLTTAQMLFAPKWDSIQHTRKFESWYMDVIKNPFVRKKYLIEPVSLLRELQCSGFLLYSSFPNYQDVLEMQWIKSPFLFEKENNLTIRFIEMSRLSHFLSVNCFSRNSLQEVNEALLSLITIADDLIDDMNTRACESGVHAVEVVRKFVKNEFPNHPCALSILKMIETAFTLMNRRDMQMLIDFCRTQEAFIAAWGMPNHYAIFQRYQ